MCLTAAFWASEVGGLFSSVSGPQELRLPLVAEPRHGSTGLRGPTHQTAAEADRMQTTLTNSSFQVCLGTLPVCREGGETTQS